MLTALFVRLVLGMLIVLFYKCMTALFNPAYRRDEGIKWGLVSYTTVTFWLATVHMVTSAHVISISFINNRNFPGGPYEYQYTIAFKAISDIPRAAFRLNNWAADGLLVSSLFGSPCPGTQRQLL